MGEERWEALGGNGLNQQQSLHCGVEHSRIIESTGEYKHKFSDEKHGFPLHSPKYIQIIVDPELRLKNHWLYKLVKLCEPSDLSQTEKRKEVSIQYKSRSEKCSRLLLFKTLNMKSLKTDEWIFFNFILYQKSKFRRVFLITKNQLPRTCNSSTWETETSGSLFEGSWKFLVHTGSLKAT